MRLTTLIRTRLEHVRNERRTRAQIEALQLKKFRRLVRHAAKRAPYYQEIIDARGLDVDRCVPQDFPVLTKTELLRNFDRIVTDPAITREKIADFLERSKDPFELYQDRYYVVHTSGTSGEVGYFVYNLDEWTRGIGSSFRAGPGFGRQRLAFFGATGGHFTGVSYALSVRRSLLGWLFHVATFEINAPLTPTLRGLNAFQPTILTGYPTALGLLARKQLEGRLQIAPRQIRSSGEFVHSADREQIERAFGRPLLNTYVSTEHLVMGMSRSEYQGLYLFEDDLIFELAADHTLVTNLFNFTLPLIRYRMSDVLVPQEDDRRTLPFTKVDELVGRNEHMPVFINVHGEEDFISPHTINEFLVKNLRRLQLRVESPTACVFRVCLQPGLDGAQRTETVAEVHQRFGALLAQKEMGNVDYRIDVVDDLPVDPKTGKFRLIVPPETIETAAAL